MQLEKESAQNPFGVSITKRYVSLGGEKILYIPHKIRDSGSVELVDYVGGDGMVERVATAGRGRGIFGNQTKSREFINFLANNGIYQPFKSVQLKLSIQSPISTALSFVYAPTANVNEYSLRYSDALETSLHFDDNRLNALRTSSFESYKGLIGVEMARELARSILGRDQDTRYFLKLDLVDLANLTQQMRRFSTLHPSVDKEFIENIGKLAYEVAPHSWRALNRGLVKNLELIMPKDNEIVDPPLSPPQWGEKETRRRTVPSVENILFENTRFLDHGEFQVVDYMGDDNALAEAARTSYGIGTKTQQDNKNLIRSLIRDAHTTPIEMAELAFEAKSPVFSDPRQAGRHRTLPWHSFMGYVPAGDKYYFPHDDEFKLQDRKNRQGRGEDMGEDVLDYAKRELRMSFERQLDLSRQLRDEGVSEEEIRRAKGVGFYTITWRTGDPHNLARFLGLRLDKHAQMEVRAYAAEIDNAMKAHTPVAHQAFHDYQLDGMRLSKLEIDKLRELFSNGILDDSDFDLEDTENYKGQGWVVPIDRNDASKGSQLTREGQSFRDKLKRILGQ